MAQFVAGGALVAVEEDVSAGSGAMGVDVERCGSWVRRGSVRGQVGRSRCCGTIHRWMGSSGRGRACTGEWWLRWQYLGKGIRCAITAVGIRAINSLAGWNRRIPWQPRCPVVTSS